MDDRTPPPRFAADAMLGRLARWLRVLGFGTSYDPTLADPDLCTAARHAAGVYWHGSHVRRMRDALQRTVPGWLS